MTIAAISLLGACTRPVIAAPPLHSAIPRPPQPLPPLQDNDWPMFRDDLERSGFAEGSTVGDHVVERWRIDSFNRSEYGAAKGSPSVVGDLLYCGTDTGRFVAVRASDGQIVWERQIEHTTHGIHGSPAIVGGVVYIGAYDGALHAIDRLTGRELWSHHVGDQVGSSPAVIPQWGVVISAHEELPHGGLIVALDARTGRELWRQHTDAHPHSSVAVDVEEDALFVGDNHGVMYRIGAHTGAIDWRRQMDGPRGRVEIKTTPMLIPSLRMVVFGSWSGHVYALDERTGATMWDVPTGGRIMSSTAYLPARDLVFAAQPAGVLYALDAFTGRTAWVFRAGGTIVSSPAVSGDGRAVVFGAGNGRLYAVRTSDGTEMWNAFVGGRVTGSPTLVGHRIYVTSRQGGLVALETVD